MSAQQRLYRPFCGLSAWFSSSVEPSTKELWEHYGGSLDGATEADFCISDDCSFPDTAEVQASQSECVMVQSSWLKEVLQQRCVVHDVVLGQHLLLPPQLTLQDTPTSGGHGNQLQTRPPTPARRSVLQAVSAKAAVRRERVKGRMEHHGGWRALEEQLLAVYISTIATLDEVRTDVELVEFNPMHPDCKLKHKAA